MEARDRLRELSLTPSPVTQVVDDPAMDGQVIGQDPGAGADVPRGQSVTLIIGRLPDRLFGESVGRETEVTSAPASFCGAVATAR